MHRNASKSYSNPAKLLVQRPELALAAATARDVSPAALLAHRAPQEKGDARLERG